jgi:glycosyltransferase involved in cell wall biosynthesis
VRILELLSSPVWTGPAEPMTSVARWLSRRGHHVEVEVDGRREGDLRERLAAEGFPPRILLALSTRAGPVEFVRDLGRLRRVARGFDVVHANFSHDHLLAVLSVARGVTRVVRTVHSSRSLADRGMQGWIHRHTDGLLAVCEAHAAILRGRFRIPAERVGIAHGAVDAEAFTPGGPDLRAELSIPADAPVAGIVSRVKPDRRHAELVDAFGRVASRLPGARLVIVGRGEGLPDLRAHVERSGLGDRVIFAGYRRGPELAAAYRTFDVKVLLAEGNDGTCRALLEGMACGRPGVAWAFGAPAESIVHGETGLLAPPDDVAALGDAIAGVLSLPDRGRALGAAARARMRTVYTEEARGRAVEAFLERVRRLPPV